MFFWCNAFLRSLIVSPKSRNFACGGYLSSSAAFEMSSIVFLPQLRSILWCASLLSISSMCDTLIWVHPFQPDLYAQMWWQETRHPSVRETSAPSVLGMLHAAPKLRPRQSSPGGRCQRQAKQPGVARLQLTTTITAAQRLPTPCMDFVQLSATAATGWMTGRRRPRKIACLQGFSRHPSLMPTARPLASAWSTGRYGSTLTTLLLPIGKMTGTGWMFGAPNSPAQQAGTPLPFLTFTQIGNLLPNSWNSGPVVLLVLLFVLIAAGD